MKKIVTSIATSAALLVLTSNTLIAGGDFMDPVEPLIDIPTQEVVVLEDDVKYAGFYVGAGLNYMRVSESTTVSGNGITLMAGYYFNQYFGIEGRYMQTITDVDIDSSRPIVSTDDTLKNYGVYLKPMYSVTTGFSLYGLAGYGHACYESNGNDIEENGFQWGLGAKYELSNGVGLFVDYLDIYDGDDFDTLNVNDVRFNATTVGATYTF